MADLLPLVLHPDEPYYLYGKYLSLTRQIRRGCNFVETIDERCGDLVLVHGRMGGLCSPL
jgi:hypothetical protein